MDLPRSIGLPAEDVQPVLGDGVEYRALRVANREVQSSRTVARSPWTTTSFDDRCVVREWPAHPVDPLGVEVLWKPLQRSDDRGLQSARFMTES